MKTSETWNQGFEYVRFDSQQGHLIAQENIPPHTPVNTIFGSQELPRCRISSGQHSREPSSRNNNEESGSGRGQSRFQYSQTQLGPSVEEIQKIEESQYEEKSIRFFELSNNGANQAQNRQIQGQYPSTPPLPQSQAMEQLRVPPPYPNQNQQDAQSRSSAGLRELEGMPHTTQQSYAPSQKTLVMMPHNSSVSPQNSHVYHSHATTERYQNQNDKKTGTSPKVSIEIGSMMRPQGTVKSVVHQSHIPPNRQYTSTHPQQMNQVQIWRDRYQQLRVQFENSRIRDMSELQNARNYIVHLQKENTNLKQSCDKLIVQYEKKIEEMKNMKKQIAVLQQNNNKGDASPVPDASLKKQLDQRGMLINLLQKENQQLGEKAQLCQHYERQIQALEESVSVLRMELEQKDMQIGELKSNKQSNLRSEYSNLAQSRAMSIDNTKVMELEMQAGRLMAEMSARDEAHEQELKLSSIKFNQLAQKLNSVISQKDHIIKILQQKNALLESDLTKKDSLLRNLRDELVEAERKKGSTQQSHITLPVAQSTTSSAINHPAERSAQKAEKDESKRELDNLRKNLFEKDREITIQNQRTEQMRQLLQQAEHTSQRRKTQIQNLKRQLAQYQDQLADYHFIKEGITKKNNELNEMRELLLQKQEHSGEYEFLNKQNQKFKEIIIKKNNELSDLDFQLREVEKKLREHEGYNPQIQALQEEVQHLTSTLRSYQSQIQRLNTEVEHGNERILQAQIQMQKEEQRYQELQNELNTYHQRSQQMEQEIQRAEQRYSLLERELESMASKLVQSEQYAEELKREDDQMRNKLEEYHLLTMNLQAQLDSIAKEHTQLTMHKIQSCKNFQQLQKKHVDQLEKKNTDMTAINHRCKQLENALKIYKQKIAKIEPECEMMRAKYSKYVNSQKTIKQLRAKVALYEQRILGTPYAKRLFDNLPQGGGKTFESKVIYQLKAQNQSLKGNLSSQRGNSPRNEELRMRLSQLAGNLEDVIRDDNIRRVRSQEKFFTYPGDMTQSKNTGIAALKTQYSNPICKSEDSLSLNQLENFYNQKMTYYRQINLELEDRVNLLVKINKQLQQKISKTSRSDQESQLKNYYNNQLQFSKQKSKKLEKQLKILEAEVKKWEKKYSQLHLLYKKLDSGEDVAYRYTLKEVRSDMVHI